MSDKDTVTIPLSRGYETVLDKADMPLVNGYKWCAIRVRTRVYAARKGTTDDSLVYLHRVIVGSMVVHKDGDGLNNRRANLIPLPGRASQSKGRKRTPTSSRFLGVYWDRQKRRWVAAITNNRTRVFLGRHASEVDAAKAYDAAAREHFHEFVLLNFPEPDELSALPNHVGTDTQ